MARATASDICVRSRSLRKPSPWPGARWAVFVLGLNTALPPSGAPPRSILDLGYSTEGTVAISTSDPDLTLHWIYWKSQIPGAATQSFKHPETFKIGGRRPSFNLGRRLNLPNPCQAHDHLHSAALPYEAQDHSVGSPRPGSRPVDPKLLQTESMVQDTHVNHTYAFSNLEARPDRGSLRGCPGINPFT
ncbi:hypothetical protein FB451DRAFT_1368148 [Mycena latifolia]|nr:hypothetical protein FB451DRAFT_1368148 [Mycena latifolia]